jgi:hypothetical protein
VSARLGEPIGTWKTTRGEVRIYAPSPGLYVTWSRGHLCTTLANEIIQAGNRLLETEPTLEVFHDWEAGESYDSAARLGLTKWGVDVRNRVTKVHVLVKSKIVKMGVAVASIALVGMLESHADRRSFEASLERARRAARPG